MLEINTPRILIVENDPVLTTDTGQGSIIEQQVAAAFNEKCQAVLVKSEQELIDTLNKQLPDNQKFDIIFLDRDIYKSASENSEEVQSTAIIVSAIINGSLKDGTIIACNSSETDQYVQLNQAIKSEIEKLSGDAKIKAQENCKKYEIVPTNGNKLIQINEVINSFNTQQKPAQGTTDRPIVEAQRYSGEAPAGPSRPPKHRREAWPEVDSPPEPRSPAAQGAAQTAAQVQVKRTSGCWPCW